jgi:hypothetical protein
VGSRAGLDGCGKSRPPPPTGIRSPDRPTRRRVVSELKGLRSRTVEVSVLFGWDAASLSNWWQTLRVTAVSYARFEI